MIQVCSVSAVLLCFLFIYVLLKSPDELSAYELDQRSQKVGSGPTEFKIYNNKVYVSVPSNGAYVIPQADAQSMANIPVNAKNSQSVYAIRQLAMDKNHVYCGNIILRDIHPQKVRSIGDGYITDGKITYFCSQGTERNDQLNPVQEVWQIILYNFGMGAKPQSYLYPFFKLDAGEKPYVLIRDGIVSNGEKTYLRGKLIAEAQGGSLRYLQSFSSSSDELYDSTRYTADGRHVYYQNQIIPIQDEPELLTFGFDSSMESEFLYDPQKKNFYYHQYKFPEKNAPYKILNKTSEHAHDPLFISPKGIWFYNRDDEELQKVGKNPFRSKFVQLAPDVYHNGIDTFYMGSYDKVIRSRQGYKTCYRSTVLYRLKNVPVNQWRKIGDVRYGGGTWSSGTIWKNGNQYYYFDEFGQGQGLNQSVYLIKDAAALQIIMNPAQSTDDIRGYRHNGTFIEPKADKAVKAKYDQRFCLFEFLSD